MLIIIPCISKASSVLGPDPIIEDDVSKAETLTKLAGM